MKILDIRTIAGPNVYNHRPVLIVNLDLESLTDIPSSQIPEFSKRLLALMPTLKEHHCSRGHVGGFIERLEKGTYLAHIIEHIGLELAELSGIGVGYGKSIYNGAPGKYKVIVRYRNEEGMKFCMEKAVEIAQASVDGATFNVVACLSEIKNIVKSNQFGPSTAAILKAADKRNIPWRRLNDKSLIQLGFGKFRQFIQATTTAMTSDIAVDIAQDKNLTKQLLDEANVRVPRGRPAQTLEEALKIQIEMGVPLAVKPIDGNHGRGVSLNVKSPEEMKSAFLLAREHSDTAMIEECMIGTDYRLLVVGAKLVAASERKPAHVIGDGVHSVKKLVDIENENPLRGTGHENVLTRISIDDETINLLHKKNLTLDHVAAIGEIVYLKETANLSTGGIAIDKTDEVHPEIKEMCERASRIIGLNICGVDLMAEDISRPLSAQNGGIIEVNAGPGIRMHHYPSFGMARDVASAIIENLYPNNSDGRIPIVAITGTNGKTTVARMLSHVVSENGQTVGTTTTDGIYINDVKIASGDTTGPHSARTILTDPAVDIAVLETARGGIVKRGLGFDWSDVGIFTNLTADHIGQDGIETLEDILKIKSLVIERVKDGGNAILNADSPEIVTLVQDPKTCMHAKTLTYFSLREDNPVVLNHLKNGGHAYFVREDEIIEAQGEIESRVIYVSDVPLTLEGTALFHIANVLAVIAGAHALGISDEVILRGLKTFNQDKNLGRTNLYKVARGYVLLDYGHNPDAILSIGEMARKWNVNKITGVVGAPGDRDDHSIRTLGQIAARVFDNIIIREDEDLRGRTSGEVPVMLKEAALAENPNLKCSIHLNSLDALVVAVKNMKENELIVYFYEELKEIEDQLLELGAEKWSDSSLFRNNQSLRSMRLKKRGDAWLLYSY